MAAFGVDDVDVGERRRASSAPGRATGRPTSSIEPDAVSASYPLAVAAVAGGRVHVAGLGADVAAGRRPFADAARRRWAATSTATTDGTDGRRGTAPLRGIDVDMADISDLVPTLAVVAAVRRHADDDHAASASSAPRRATASATCADRAARAPASTPPRPPTGCVIRAVGRPHGGAARRRTTTIAWRWRSACSALPSTGIEVDDPDVVSKSWPGYWAMLDESRST